MHDLSQSLHFVESDFPAALKGGAQTLASYLRTWSALPNALHTASQTGRLDNGTVCLAYSVASRIANLASCFLDIRHWEESSTTSLQRDCDALLHQMAALDLNADPKPLQPDSRNDSRCSQPHSKTPVSNLESSSPPFVSSAHRWLVDNLHNPYPSAEVKAQMAATTLCPVSSINSWFINARRRIGWTTLCRERFSNCRADMVDAAYRALVEEDPQHPLSPELSHSFVKMKVAAEGLYSSTFSRSAFARDLDAIVKDMMEGDGKSVEVGTCSVVNKSNLSKAAQDSYPSPDSFITASPLPALVGSLTDGSEEDEEDTDIAPSIIAGSKRSRSSMEPVDQPSSANRPIKRLRASMTSRTCLPSPPPSTDGGVDESSDHGSPDLSTVHSTPPEQNKELPSRKQRLSDAGATGLPKHPSDPMVAPHFQPPPALSDPLSRPNMESEYSIDDWFKTNFDDLFTFPPPVDASQPDFSASWEVELFKDYSIPGNERYAPTCSSAAMANNQTDLSDLDNLLQSIGGDTFVTPSDSMLPSNVTGNAYLTSLDSSIPDISQTNIDWMSLLNGIEAHQPTVYPTFSQYPTSSQPLPEIDLSMLQLPQVVPTVDSRGDFATKQAKLHQLHAMQEAVWRMEQELRSEGVVV